MKRDISLKNLKIDRKIITQSGPGGFKGERLLEQFWTSVTVDTSIRVNWMIPSWYFPSFVVVH